MRLIWVQPPVLVRGKAAGDTEHNGERSDCLALLSGRESFPSHQNTREEREGSKQQPETPGSRRGRQTETHTEC